MELLSPREQANIHRNYGLKIAAAIPIGTGAMSSTMAIETDRGKLFLKRYKPASDHDLNPPTHVSRITFTHAIQDYLGKREFPIPLFLRNRGGATLTVEDSDIYAISEFVEGFDFDAVQSTGALQSAGEMLGRIHRELRGFQPASDFNWIPMHDEVINLLHRRLERIRLTASETAGYPVSQKQIDDWIVEVGELAAELSVADESDWIIHGDYRAQNLKFDPDGMVKAILDLDAARPANRATDLAYALVFFPAVYQDTPLTPRQKSMFLQAYEAICPLTGEERNDFPAHLRLGYLRGMMLWLHLHDLGGMRERVRPWIQGFLNNEASLTQ